MSLPSAPGLLQKGAIVWTSSSSEETLQYLLQHLSDAVRRSGPVRYEANTSEVFHRAHSINRPDPPNANAVLVPTATCDSSCLPMDS